MPSKIRSLHSFWHRIIRILISVLFLRACVCWWGWALLVTYQQNSVQCQQLICVTPAANSRILVINGSGGIVQN